MSLTSGLDMAIHGMMTASLKTSLTSQNITNADKVGYSRKALQMNYLTTDAGSTPVSGIVVGSTDKFLTKALVGDISTYNSDITVTNSLDYYIKQLGSTDGTNSLSTYMDTLYSALQYLATNPEAAANKSEVIQTAENMTSTLRSVSDGIQKLRLDSEQKIASSIQTVNNILDRIDVLNEKVSATTLGDASVADYEDQRVQELQNLAAEMDIQYYYTSDNRIQIYSGGGQAMLLSDPRHITYSATNAITGSTVYPGGFSPIDLNGVDITTSITGGKLSGLINLRDDIYVDEQSKLDEFVSVLKTQVNTLLNKGASIPPRSLMEGSLKGLTLATGFSASGQIRVAITNTSGTVQNYSDINLATMTTINDVVTALNGVAGITASLNTQGQLSISVSPTTNGVVINPLTSAVTSSTGESFSQYFGLNDLFTGTNAEDVAVSTYLLSNPQYLSTSVLSSSATLAVGDRGVNRGDGTIASQIATMLNSNVSFAAAGDFAAQSNTLQHYAQAIISSAASKADMSEKQSNTTYQVFKTSNDLLTSSSGVNVDEETTKLLLYQNQYQAGAQIVKTIQEMMDALLAALR